MQGITQNNVHPPCQTEKPDLGYAQTRGYQIDSNLDLY